MRPCGCGVWLLRGRRADQAGRDEQSDCQPCARMPERVKALGQRRHDDFSSSSQTTRLRKKIFGLIDAEWHLTMHALEIITGEKQRLANNAALQRSIKHRFPYIDPLHHLQVELIRRYRDGKTDERVQRGIHISINGIAAGLRNTG